jgi:hypothetical protein
MLCYLSYPRLFLVRLRPVYPLTSRALYWTCSPTLPIRPALVAMWHLLLPHYSIVPLFSFFVYYYFIFILIFMTPICVSEASMSSHPTLLGQPISPPFRSMDKPGRNRPRQPHSSHFQHSTHTTAIFTPVYIVYETVYNCYKYCSKRKLNPSPLVTRTISIGDYPYPYI